MSDDHSPACPEPSRISDRDLQSTHAELLHRQREPVQGFLVMPLFMLGFVSTMIFGVAIFFIHHRAGLTEDISLATIIHHEGYDPDKHAVEIVPVAVDPVAAGARLYTQVCATCHQLNGMGLAPAFPTLVASDWVTGDEEKLIKIVLHGLTGEIEVNGTTFNGLMPAFAEEGYNWNDDRISYVLTYIRQAWGNAAEPITPEEVGTVRVVESARTTPYTVDDL